MSKKSGAELKAITAAIREIFFSNGLEERQKISSCWESKFNRIAKHARLEKMINGRLEIRVDSSAWLQQVSLLKAEIRNTINKSLKKDAIKEIVAKLGK